MINKKALLMVAAALVTALILSSLTVTRTARSEETQGNPDIVMFLQINGIPGESTEELHMNWIDIDAFRWGESMANLLMAGRSSGKLNMTNFHFLMNTNKASPLLFLACAIGKIIPNAKLEVCMPMETGPFVFLRFDFTDVTITSYSIAGTTPMDRSEDEFSIAFNAITMTYRQIGPDGSVISTIAAYYNLVTNSGGIIPPT